MIKNSKQAAITKAKLEQLKNDFKEFVKTQQAVLHPVRYKLGVNAFEGLIKDLGGQLQRYENLTSLPTNLFSGYDVRQLADILTQVRLAKNLSQKDLAGKLDIQEQQIQRYEQDDYTKASWSRILEVYEALGLDIKMVSFEVGRKIKKMPATKSRMDKKWRHPTNIKLDDVKRATQLTKHKKSLFNFSK